MVLYYKVLYEIMLKYSFGVDFIIFFIESKSKINELIVILVFFFFMYIFLYVWKSVLFGLFYDYFRFVIERGGVDGLKMVLGEKIE